MYVFFPTVFSNVYFLGSTVKILSINLRDKPIALQFVIGKGLLIPGWELGLLKMKKGGKRCLVIPYQLAYGHRGYDGIPPYSTLIFEIELIDIEKK